MWPVEDVLCLIKLYENHPFLWCTTHEHFNPNDGLRRGEDIAEICDSLNLVSGAKPYTKVQVKDKIKTLRLAYQRQLVENKRKKPEWVAYFERLSFLDGHIEIEGENIKNGGFRTAQRISIKCDVINTGVLRLEDFLKKEDSSKF